MSPVTRYSPSFEGGWTVGWSLMLRSSSGESKMEAGFTAHNFCLPLFAFVPIFHDHHRIPKSIHPPHCSILCPRATKNCASSPPLDMDLLPKQYHRKGLGLQLLREDAQFRSLRKIPQETERPQSSHRPWDLYQTKVSTLYPGQYRRGWVELTVASGCVIMRWIQAPQVSRSTCSEQMTGDHDE